MELITGNVDDSLINLVDPSKEKCLTNVVYTFPEECSAVLNMKGYKSVMLLEVPSGRLVDPEDNNDLSRILANSNLKEKSEGFSNIVLDHYQYSACLVKDVEVRFTNNPHNVDIVLFTTRNCKMNEYKYFDIVADKKMYDAYFNKIMEVLVQKGYKYVVFHHFGNEYVENPEYDLFKCLIKGSFHNGVHLYYACKIGSIKKEDNSNLDLKRILIKDIVDDVIQKPTYEYN